MERGASSSRTEATTPSKRARLTGPLLALLTAGLTILALEIGFRLADFDFEFKAHAFNKIPIFCRQPVVPVGPAFFRRSGPDRWQGQVIATCARMNGDIDGAYRDEPVLTVTYDRLGFRNAPGLQDWDVVVAGDSFTELGYLPYEDLFTTRLGDLLKVRVKNLGVSYTGTLTHTFYLKEYGKSPSTADAILVFFEGNDVLDIAQEHQALEKARHGEVRSAPVSSRLETLPRQSSLLRAVYRLLAGHRQSLEGASPTNFERLQNWTAAYFVWGGTRTPLTLDYVVPSSSDLPAEARSLVVEAIAGWGEAAKGLGLRPWLAYMPCKRRVLDGYLTSREGEPLPVVQSDLLEFVRGITTGAGIRFVDLTPALRKETEEGRLTYNAIRDTHLNRLGSLAVGEALAEALEPVVGAPPH